MRDVNAALYQFWSGFGVPAYRSGRVPDDAELPYITFDAAVGEFGYRTILTAYNWHKAPGATAAAADLLDAIARKIPNSGFMLPVDGRGYMLIYRNGGEFQSYVEDEMDKDVIGGRTSYEAHFFLM